MKIQWDDMQTILALVRCGTLSAAGSELGLSYTTVARRVQRAEAAAGRVLFERQPEGYVATAEARDIAAAAAQMEDAQLAMERRMAGQDRSLSGPLTVTAPQLLIQAYLAPRLEEFTRAYPQIELLVKAGYSQLDLARREADVAIRISRAPGDTLVGRQLTAQKSAVFAAPGVARRAQEDPEAPLDWLLYSGHSTPLKMAVEAHPASRVRARFDDMGALIAAAQAGMGALKMPVFLARLAPDLVPLPHLPLLPYAPVWLLTHRDLQNAGKVRALKDLLFPWFRENSARFTTL